MPDSPPQHPNVPDPPEVKPKMKTTISATKCCGVLEIDNLSASETPGEAFDEILCPLAFNTAPLVIFTGIVKLGDGRTGVTFFHPTPRVDNYGQTFADWIKEKELGKVMTTFEVLGKTMNTIQMWVWKVNRDKIKAIYKERNPQTELR